MTIKIIKDVEKLRSTYVPKRLLFRGELTNKIKTKSRLGAGNFFIYGTTGTGKTASVLNALEDEERLISIYINCAQYNTYGSIVKIIIDEIRKINYKERGKSTSNLADDILKVLKTKREKRLIFIFDEVDKLINKERDHQQILSLILENTNANLILISNDINASQKLDPRIQSRLSPEKVFVRPYYANEIFEILKERVKEGLYPNSFEDEDITILEISRWIYKTSGDLREALNILYESSITAESKQQKITSKLISETKKRVGEIEFDQYFWALPEHQRIIIGGIALLSLQEPEGFAEHKKLYFSYEKWAKNQGFDAMGFRQFERILKKLESFKIIQITTRTPKNRRGRLVVSFPKFDAQKFVDANQEEGISDYARPVGEGV